MHASGFIDITSPSPETNALYDACTQAAHALDHFLRTENELLFAGLGSQVLSNPKALRRKEALTRAHTRAANALADAIQAGKIATSHRVAKAMRMTKSLHQSLRINGHLLREEIEKTRIRVEAIMHRIETGASVDPHGELPMHLLAGTPHVTH